MEYFQNQLSKDHVSQGDDILCHIPTMISAEDNQALDVFPSIEEVQKVIYSLDPNNTAGPDGFNGGFYQICWKIIKSGLFDSVLEFFAGFNQPRSWTSTQIFPILKVAVPSSL